MRRAGVRLVLGLVILLGPLLTLPWPAQAQGADPCPEPNDDFQNACYLGPAAEAVGTLGQANDIDAYRFEALDAEAHVQLTLADATGAYRLNLADWTGKIIAESSAQDGSQVIDATLGPPGSYYVFVDSRTGEVVPGAAYHLRFQPTYLGPAPHLLYSREFRPGADDNQYPPTEEANFLGGGGKVTVVMKVGGSPEQPREASVTLGPAVTDFTFIVDARIANAETAVDAVYWVGFRTMDDGSAYRALVDVHQGAIKLQRVMPDGATDLTGWTASPAIDQHGGVNRTIVRAIGNQVQVDVNGLPALEATIDAVQGGRFALGITTRGEPPIVSYDNVLVTSAGR